jgi:hypothetical protein
MSAISKLTPGVRTMAVFTVAVSPSMVIQSAGSMRSRPRRSSEPGRRGTRVVSRPLSTTSTRSVRMVTIWRGRPRSSHD